MDSSFMGKVGEEKESAFAVACESTVAGFDQRSVLTVGAIVIAELRLVALALAALAATGVITVVIRARIVIAAAAAEAAAAIVVVILVTRELAIGAAVVVLG